MPEENRLEPWSDLGPYPLVEIAQDYLNKLEGQYTYTLPPGLEQPVNDAFKLLEGLVKAVNCLIEIERQRVKSPVFVLDAQDKPIAAIEEYTADQVRLIRDAGLHPRDKQTESGATIFRLHDLDVSLLAFAAAGMIPVGVDTLFSEESLAAARQRVVNSMGPGGADQLMSMMLSDSSTTMDSAWERIRALLKQGLENAK